MLVVGCIHGTECAGIAVARRVLYRPRDADIWSLPDLDPDGRSAGSRLNGEALVRAWGPSVPAARRYARLVGLPFRRMRWPAGTAPHWQNTAFPGTASSWSSSPPGR